jgi:putative hydrolase of the HAD superfamily
MADRPLKAILFDIGRVLIRVDVSRSVAGFAEKIPLSPPEIWTAIEKDPRWQDWQEGRFSARDWHLHLAKRLGGALSFEQFSEAWNRALDPQPIHDSSLFESLKKNHKLGLVSNTDPIHVAHMEASYDFFRHFPTPARTYSCVVGASKPAPLIFREALRSLRVNAEETVFIDDIEAYVEAARRLGMQGIHYQSPSQLIEDLLALGASVQV